MKITSLVKISILLCFCVCTSILEAQVKKQNSINLSACVAGKSEGKISKNELLVAGGLGLKNSPDPSIVFSSFRLTTIRKNSGFVEYINNKNGKFTDEMKNAIQSLHSGDKTYFEYIRVQFSDSSSRSLPALAFSIE